MSYIYKIVNDIDNKVYIGVTKYSLDKRFKEHCYDSAKCKDVNRPLYIAMRIYGISHFSIIYIETTDKPYEREKYWIDYYDSYNSGYNSTYGGLGKPMFSHEDIKNRLIEYPYASEVAKEFNCCKDIVYEVADKYNIQLENFSNEAKSLPVTAYSKDGKKIISFNSVYDAALWVAQTQQLTYKITGIKSHISAVAKGKRKSAYTYIWVYE